MGTKSQIILCDIDGTICDIRHRLHFIDDEIRVGDTVYRKGIPNSKEHPGIVVEDQFDGHFQPFVCGYKASFSSRMEWNGVFARSELRKAKSWKKFFEACVDDSPIQTTIDVLEALQAKWPVVFMSGRPETYRAQTEGWLNLNTFVLPYSGRPLFMRPANDTREDFIVKRELYEKYIEPNYEVKLVLDDRSQVVSEWRRLGLTCWQVAPGDF